MRIPSNREFTRITPSAFSYHRLKSYVSDCRAVLLPSFGGPHLLELRSHVPVPPLKPHEVLVRTRAASVNPLDTRMRAGYGRSIFERLLPLILGRDISGEVAAVGASVTSVSVGEQVFGALHPTAVRGTYTDYAILSEDEVTPKPDSLTHVEASAIPFAALTAWRALKCTARISEGQRILVVGGGGAVGFIAIQLAVAAGCSVVTTCGSQSVDRLLAAGAEQAVDYVAEVVLDILLDHFFPRARFDTDFQSSLSPSPPSPFGPIKVCLEECDPPSQITSPCTAPCAITLS
ncbi:unnamed protein product [Sphenostylis stenocarpa]|uniref:Enoyl reductase (ER) domain-containing protein n=1 Tax=Sphenostylis stenocarpa TaxID=92480 RepID=A0AA86VLX5_9FABA|nr:unnamed protein product [Sphenostylis stenocarpa]